MFIEYPYVSKDYLHDYASYYSLCFQDYSKFCKRIHFFSSVIEEKDVREYVFSENEEIQKAWRDLYLGFIVAKPIPLTVFGFSVVKSFSEIGGIDHRDYWGTRIYKVHLFGRSIEFKSLAFQEQDSIVAACATTAVWSMLQKASTDYDTVLKTPSQITKDADYLSIDGSRLFPNKGLSILQICQAIQKSGLVSEVKQGDVIINLEGHDYYSVSNTRAKQIIHAYSGLGIPIILGIAVPSGSDQYGRHAIAVTGSKMKAPVASPLVKSISWLSENIEKIYAHDDQFGPFVRIKFINDVTGIITPWTEQDPALRQTIITDVVVPIYPKVRISLEDIQSIVYAINNLYYEIFQSAAAADFTWDIKLRFSEDYKGEIRSFAILDEDVRLRTIQKSMPKYIWVARCYIKDTCVCDFTFDATDLATGMFGIAMTEYVTGLKTILKEFTLKNPSYLDTIFSPRFKDFFIRAIDES